MKKIKIFTVYLIVLFAGSLLIAYPKTCSQGAYNGVILCIKTLIPSLLPFMVLSVFITDSGLYRKIFYFPSLIISKFFCVDMDIISIFILGMIGGYPAAAKIISIQLNKGNITRETAEILLCFCTNAGPAFLISAVGSSMFLNANIGVILYISSVISSLSLMIYYAPLITTKTNSPPINMKYSPLNLFISSVKDSAIAMCNISVFIILFSIFVNIFSHNKSLFVIKILLGLWEVTSGCEAFSSENTLISILATSFVCGFGGLCILLQITSICSSAKIRIKKFVLSRIIHAFTSAFYTYLLLHIIPTTSEQTYLSNTSEAIFSYFMAPIPAAALLLCCFSLPFFLSKQKN